MADESEEAEVAAGYGVAALNFQGALLAQLVLQGTLSPTQAESVYQTAMEALDRNVLRVSPDALEIARGALRGLARTWSQPRMRN
jgi:hypothetical protein